MTKVIDKTSQGIYIYIYIYIQIKCAILKILECNLEINMHYVQFM